MADFYKSINTGTDSTVRYTHTVYDEMPPVVTLPWASLYSTLVSSAIMTSLQNRIPPSARKWMSAIPSFFSQIDERHDLFLAGCSGAPVHPGPHPFYLLYRPFTSAGLRGRKNGENRNDIMQEWPQQEPRRLLHCFHFPRKLNRLERLFSDGRLR